MLVEVKAINVMHEWKRERESGKVHLWNVKWNDPVQHFPVSMECVGRVKRCGRFKFIQGDQLVFGQDEGNLVCLGLKFCVVLYVIIIVIIAL